MNLVQALLDELAESGVPVSLGTVPVWAIESSTPNAFYLVAQTSHGFVCSCKGARYGHVCRHIKAVGPAESEWTRGQTA